MVRMPRRPPGRVRLVSYVSASRALVHGQRAAAWLRLGEELAFTRPHDADIRARSTRSSVVGRRGDARLAAERTFRGVWLPVGRGQREA
jgi:hypothetical protein